MPTTTLEATGRAPRPAHPRWFYPAAGLVMLIFTVLGFQLFYFHGRSHPGREIPPPIRTLIIAHAVAMSAWILLFAAQPILVAQRNVRLHRAVGRVGAGIAAAVVVLGLMLGIQSARVTPPEVILWGLPPAKFMAVPVISILLFGVLVTAAVWKRRRPAVHRSLMFLATLVIIPAAVSRIDALSNLYAGTAWDRVFGPFFTTIIAGGVLVGLRCALSRSVDRWLVAGVAGFALTSALIMALARTAAWDSLAAAVLR